MYQSIKGQISIEKTCQQQIISLGGFHKKTGNFKQGNENTITKRESNLKRLVEKNGTVIPDAEKS